MKSVASAFDEALTVDAQNIRSLGVKFDEFDRDVSTMLQAQAPKPDR